MSEMLAAHCCVISSMCQYPPWEMGVSTEPAIRAHVVLPKSIIEAIDELVGPRRRSRFVEEAIEERLVRERQRRALAEIAASGGVLDPADYPEWATPEQTTAWVRKLREEADANTMRKIGRSES